MFLLNRPNRVFCIAEKESSFELSHAYMPALWEGNFCCTRPDIGYFLLSWIPGGISMVCDFGEQSITVRRHGNVCSWLSLWGMGFSTWFRPGGSGRQNCQGLPPSAPLQLAPMSQRFHNQPNRTTSWDKLFEHMRLWGYFRFKYGRNSVCGTLLLTPK